MHNISSNEKKFSKKIEKKICKMQDTLFDSSSEQVSSHHSDTDRIQQDDEYHSDEVEQEEEEEEESDASIPSYESSGSEPIKGRKKNPLKSKIDLRKVDPELYGLRRSGRASHQV